MNRINLLVLISLLVVIVFHLIISQRFNLPLFIGDRSEAIFDLWSFQHFFTGMLLGSFLLYSAVFKRLKLTNFLAAVFLLALGWELTELLMEAGWFGQAVAHWKGSYEHWGNRFIGDLLMVTSGGYLAWRYHFVWRLVAVPAAVWLIINIISPTSMSVQNSLLAWIF